MASARSTRLSGRPLCSAASNATFKSSSSRSSRWGSHRSARARSPMNRRYRSAAGPSGVGSGSRRRAAGMRIEVLGAATDQEARGQQVVERTDVPVGDRRETRGQERTAKHSSGFEHRSLIRGQPRPPRRGTTHCYPRGARHRSLDPKDRDHPLSLQAYRGPRSRQDRTCLGGAADHACPSASTSRRPSRNPRPLRSIPSSDPSPSTRRTAASLDFAGLAFAYELALDSQRVAWLLAVPIPENAGTWTTLTVFAN